MWSSFSECFANGDTFYVKQGCQLLFPAVPGDPDLRLLRLPRLLLLSRGLPEAARDVRGHGKVDRGQGPGLAQKLNQKTFKNFKKSFFRMSDSAACTCSRPWKRAGKVEDT